MGLKKGAWTPEEDKKLISFINKHGNGNWLELPKQAGLMRCGRSCRLRRTNYLRPNIKRGNFSLQEEWTIIQLHHILGNRWSAIASHLPGRKDNEIKNVWNTHLKKRRLLQIGADTVTHAPRGYNVCSCYCHGEKANHHVKMSFKREGNSNVSVARQPMQETKALQDQEASNKSLLIQKTLDGKNMVNSDQPEDCDSLNTSDNNYSYSSASLRMLSTKPMEFVSGASPFGLYSGRDKEQTKCEKLAAVMPLDYTQTGEKIMPAMDYTSLHQSIYTDSLKFMVYHIVEDLNSSEYQVNLKHLAGNQLNFDRLRCGEFQEHDKAVVQQEYPEGNVAYDSSMLNNNVDFRRHELCLWLGPENNKLGDQVVEYSSSLEGAAVLSGQQHNLKQEPFSVGQFLEARDQRTGTGGTIMEGRSNIYDRWPDMNLADQSQGTEPFGNFSVGQFLEPTDHRTGTGTIMEGRSNIYDRWPVMNFADQDQGTENWVNLVRQVGPLPYLGPLFTIAGQTCGQRS